MLGVNQYGRYFQYNYNSYTAPIQRRCVPALPYFPTTPFNNHETFDKRHYPANQHFRGLKYPNPESSLGGLQSSCNQARQTQSYFSNPPNHQSRKLTTAPKPHSYNNYNEEEADWFDFGDEILDGNSQIVEPRYQKLFPVHEEPVVPIEKLTVALMVEHEFYCDDQDFIQVYTDGSYINGRCKLIDSVSAIGVWFGPHHKLNISQPTRLGGFNSDGAELEAIIEAIKTVCSCGVEKIQINTDSKNSVRFVTYFINKWEANGWRNMKGYPVRNQSLIRQLYHYTQLVTIKWNYVPRSGGVQGNVEADRLARMASASCAEKRKKPNLSTKKTPEPLLAITVNRTEKRNKLRRYCPY